MLIKKTQFFIPRYDDNDDGNSNSDAGDSGNTDAGNGATGNVSDSNAGSGDNTDAGEKDKKFTQSDVNRFMAEEKRKLREQNDKLIQELETIKSSAGMTEKEKSRLENQIEEIRTQSMTEKEKAQREKKKLEAESNKTITEFKEKSEKWEKLYTEEKITRTLMDAAVEQDAFSPQQIVQILRGSTRLVEEEDGSIIPKVRFDDVDKDGKPVTLELSGSEAVKRMKDLPENYGNLFKNGATGGLGSMNVGSRGKSSYNLSDPVEYRKHRKEIIANVKK